MLGPLQVEGNADGLGPRDRVVLSALVVRAGAPVTQEALADARGAMQCRPRAVTRRSRVMVLCLVFVPERAHFAQ